MEETPLSQEERRNDYMTGGRLQAIEEKLDKLIYALHGNGSPGLKTIVDRHDQQLRIVSWAVGITVTAFILAAVSKVVGAW